MDSRGPLVEGVLIARLLPWTSQPWAEQDCAQTLDDQFYGWQATLSSLQR